MNNFKNLPFQDLSPNCPSELEVCHNVFLNQKPICFNCLVLSLCILKHILRHTARIITSEGWSGLPRIDMGRFIEVESRINWARCACLGCFNRALDDKCRDMVFSKSAITLALVPAVPLQQVRRWTIVSSGAGQWGESVRQSLRCGPMPLSLSR